jgi:hypothetical protein
MVKKPFRERIALLLEMQKRRYPVLRQRRAPRWWERPWKLEP